MKQLENAVNYHYGEFPPSNIDSNKFLEPLLNATASVARYDQMLKGMHNSEILLAPLRNQEAVISSRMEGTISTLDEILRYKADQEDELDEDRGVRSEIIETFLYERTLKTAQHQMEEGHFLSKSFIKQLHQGLLFYGRGSKNSPGQFKTEQNFLGDKLRKEIKFIPISPEQLDPGLDRLLKYIEKSDDSALIKIAIAHVEFEALHPFKDGNGRIGRMLITLMLWSLGVLSAPHFYISAYFEENKSEYIERLREVSRSGSWNEWCEFFLKAVDKEATRNLAVAEKIRGLYEEMKEIFSDKLSSKWSLAALDFLFTYPVFRNSRFTSKSGIPGPTAARFTRILLEEKLIETVEEAAGSRAALYSFEPLMEVVRV